MYCDGNIAESEMGELILSGSGAAFNTWSTQTSSIPPKKQCRGLNYSKDAPLFHSHQQFLCHVFTQTHTASKKDEI